VSDPESGPAPQADGASAAERRKGKSSRRAKRKRGHGRPNAHSAEANQAGKSGQVVQRPAEDEAGSPARKRKRRRRARGAVQGGAQPASSTQQLSSPVEHRASPDHGHASSHKSGKSRRKHRSKRGLQGRPLAHEKTAQIAAPTNAQASAHAPAHDDHRQNRQSQPRRDGQQHHADADPRPLALYAALDLAPSGRLSSDAMDRAVEALRICAAKLKTREIRRMRLIATEACRAADNGEAFLSRVTEETGLRLEIIDRETEARLAVSGCSSLVGPEARSVVLFDIGGGSSEIAVIRIGDNRSSRLANHITHWTSLPVGVVTLSERHGGRDVTPELFETMVCEVQRMLERFDCPPVNGAARESGDFHLIGTSGTVTTLAGVHLDLPRYDRRRVDGVWLSDDEVSAMQAKLLSWDFAGRAANPCIGPDRADLVLAGCAILEAIRRRWPSPRMRVADRGLREGLLTDMMADDGVWRRGRSRRGHRPRDMKGPQT